jgi:hypothetical protein
LGKRSKYERREADFYPTPKAAVEPLIPHLRGIRMLPHDWSANKGSASYLRHCSDIVPIGRVKWIPDSAHNGYENSCWYCFDARHASGPVLHGRDQGEPARRTRVCAQCGRPYELQRAISRFCSQGCKQMAYRKRLSVTPSVTSVGGEFRNVRHADVPRFMEEGWELLPALDGTHHGEYSALMRRRI